MKWSSRDKLAIFVRWAKEKKWKIFDRKSDQQFPDNSLKAKSFQITSRKRSFSKWNRKLCPFSLSFFPISSQTIVDCSKHFFFNWVAEVESWFTLETFPLSVVFRDGFSDYLNLTMHCTRRVKTAIFFLIFTWFRFLELRLKWCSRISEQMVQFMRGCLLRKLLDFWTINAFRIY